MSDKKPALAFIFITLLIDIIGLAIIIPVLPALMQEVTGGTIGDASEYGGWMLFAYAFMQLICAPIMGGLSDRYGRRPVLLASLFGFGLDYLLMAFAPTLAWLFVGRIIAGMMGASFTTASAYIADVSPPEKRAQNFGMIGAAFGLGFIIGPVVGGFLGEFGPRVPFMVAAGLTFLNWLYGFFILPESLPAEHRRKFDWKRANPISPITNLKRHPVVLGLVTSLVLVYIAAHAVQTNWPYYTTEKFNWDTKTIGISLMVVGAVFAVVNGFLIRFIIAKLGQARTLYVGLGFSALGFILFAMATQSWMMFAFTVVYCLGGIAGPALQGIISSAVPPNEQGELQGSLTALFSLTSMVGPLLMSYTFAYFIDPARSIYLPSAPMILGAVLTVIATYMARSSLKRTMAASHQTPVKSAQ